MRFLVLALLLLLPVRFVHAEVPMPSAHPVQEVEQELKEREAREKKLKAELKDIKTDLSKKRNNMVEVARKISQNEKDLTNLEARIDAKRQEQLAIEVRLNEDRGSISDLVLALERVRRIPPEALIAKPGAPLETAQSAMLLQSVLPRVYDRAEGLKADLAHLKTIIEDLKKDRAEVLATSKKLEKNHNQLASLLKERESLYAKTEKDVKVQQAELKKISLQASNLRDLVARIEKKQKEEDARRARQKASSGATSQPYKTPVPKAGQAQLPISGVIRVSYGKSDEIGAVSQGLKIESRPQALVVAPMGGVVDYAGPFKGYGQIIILKHEKGYHSLIAGLGKIDTVVGRAVSAGEPIGAMGAKLSENEAPTLYYELRYNGQPVNPSKKISGLY